MRKSTFYFHLYKRGLGLCCTFYPVRPLTLTLSRRAREYNASLHKGGGTECRRVLRKVRKPWFLLTRFF